MKNLSIITNFWCIFNCSSCITKSQKIKNSFIFTKEDERILKNTIEKHLISWIDRISVSWWGDPFYIHNEEIGKFYKFLHILRAKYKFHLSIHTNYGSNIRPEYKFDKYVVSVNKYNYKIKIHNWKKDNTRFVYVSNWNDLDIIKSINEQIPSYNQFTVKELYWSKKDYWLIIKYLSDFTNTRFLKSWDYNIYYNMKDKKIYTDFQKLKITLINNKIRWKNF